MTLVLAALAIAVVGIGAFVTGAEPDTLRVDAAAPAAPAKTAGAQPAPLVQPFARSPEKPARKPGPKRLTTPVPKGVDGCDHSYGNAQQCVPKAFPPGVTDKCAWLAKHGLKSFKSKTEDKLGLDTSKDGVACGTGD